MAMLYHGLKISYLSEEQLAGFHKYKYRCIDTSPFSQHVMHPFWNWILQFFPYWLAPNLMTFTGWILSVLSFALLSYWDWDFTTTSLAITGKTTIPSWVWLFCAVSFFCAHTLDGIDGKQARRTGSSSPLGELFDHGLDSSEALLMPIAVISVTGIGPQSVDAKAVLLMELAICFGFYTSHWEKYNTSALFLPWVYDISQVALVSAFFLTAIFGTKLVLIRIYGDYMVGHLAAAVMGGGSVLGAFPISLYNIYRARKEKQEDCRPFQEGLMPMLPLTIAFSLVLIWAYGSPLDIVDKEPRIFYTAVGMLFSNICCRLIVCQMSGGRCERFNPLIYPLLITLPCVLLNIGNERQILYVYCTIAILAHIHYGICVVNQLCDELNIRCFKLSHSKVANGAHSVEKKN